MKSVNVQVVVTPEQIASLLVSAFEGGSNYWYQIVGEKKPKKFETFAGRTLEQLQKSGEVKGNKGPTIYNHVDYPMNPEGNLTIKQTIEKGAPGIRLLNAKRLAEGLQELAASEKYGFHFANIINDNADQNTADVYLQFCLYGDCIYS